MSRCRAIAIVVATTLGVLLAGLRQETLFAQIDEPVPEFVPDFAAGLTPEQFAAGNEFIDNVGWMFWSLAEGILVIEEPEEMVELDQSELDEVFDSDFEQIRAKIKAQMLFLKKSGNLSDEQFQSISECGEYTVKEAVRAFAIESLRSNNYDAQRAVDARQNIQKTLLDFVRSQLSEEQARLYEIELAARNAHRKRVTILNVVARLDADLLLAPEQRVQFTKLMESEWHDSWGESLSALMPDSNFVPALPDDKVLAILKDYQQAVWKTKDYNREWNGWDDDPLGLLQDDGELDADPDEMKPEESNTEKPLANRE